MGCKKFKCDVTFFSSSAHINLLRIIVLTRICRSTLMKLQTVSSTSVWARIWGALNCLNLKNAFLGAFSKLKQHVLWKWESDTLPGQPSNVKLGKWLPQSDILGEYCYIGKTVGIPCMRGGTYWRQWLRSSLASLREAFYLVHLYLRFR